MIVCNASNRHVAAMRHMNEGREQLSHGEFLTRVSPSRISDAQQALRCAHGRHVVPSLVINVRTESKPPHAAKDRAGCGDYSKRYETVALGMGNTTFRF